MPLPIRLVGWQGASAGLRSYGLCDNRAKLVRCRGFDKGICAVACAKKGSSSKHLTFGSFCQVQAIKSIRIWKDKQAFFNYIGLFLGEKKNKAQPARRR